MAKTPTAKDKIRIKIKSFDHKLIDQSAKMIIEAAQRNGSVAIGPIPLPTRIEKFTILRSTFVHKNARLQYERRTHKRIIDLTWANAKVIDALSRLDLPAGVGLEIKML